MNKKLIFEEVSRMHTLMGVKNSKATFLLKEDISTGFARILGDFISASARGASEIELASILKTLNADERKFLDEFVQDAKKAGKSADISLESLIKGIAGADMYKALVNTIKSNQDIFFSSLGKKFNIKSLPTALSSKQQADMIMGKLYNSSNPQVRNIVQKLETGGAGLLPAERKLFVGELRKLNDPTATSMADELESGFKILDDVDTELKGGTKTVDADYDELVFDEVSGEWVSKAEKEAGDAAKGADEGGDAVKGADEVGDDSGIDDFWKKIDAEEETGGTTPIVELTTKELQDKYRKLYKDSPTEFKMKLDELRGRIKNLKPSEKLTKDDMALLDIAGSNGLIGKNDPIYTFINKNILADPTVADIQDLIKNYTAWKKSGGKTTFNDFCKQNGYTPPGWFKKNVAAKGLNVVEGYIATWQRTLSRIDPSSGEVVSWGQYFKDLGVVISSSLLLAGTAISVFTDLDDVVLKAIYKTDPMQKQQITKNLTEYFGYTSPILIVDGKQFNIYDPKLGKDNPNFAYRTQAPNPDFTLGNVDKLEFGLEPGLFVSGRTFNIFRLNPQNEKLIGGSEILGKAHTLTALDTGAQGVSTSTTTTTGGKVADEAGVSKFLTTTPTKPTIEAGTLKLVEKGTDGIDKYTVNLVLPNGDKYAGYKLKFNTKDGTWASNQ